MMSLFSVKACLIALYYFILDSATSLRVLVRPDHSSDLYIELPVTSRPPSHSHIAIYKAFIQRFILTSLSTWYLAVHIFVNKLCYIISWNYPKYLRRIENSIRVVRAATLKGLGGPYCCIKPSPPSEARVHQLSRWIIEDFQTPLYSHAYMHVPSIPSKSEPSFGRAASDKPAKHAVEVQSTAHAPYMDRIEYPALSSASDSTSSLRSSLTTPRHPPGPNEFGMAIISTNFKDEVDMAEFRVENTVSSDATTICKGLPIDRHAKFPASKTSSINSFGRIERLFEAGYGSPIPCAIEELLVSWNKFCIPPPDPIAVYSARLCYDVSACSSDTYSPNSSLSMDTIRQHNILEEEDITSAIRSPENLEQELVDVSFTDDDTHSEADMTIANMASFSSDLALNADTSPSARSDILASLDHSILAMEEILGTTFNQEIQTESSVVSSQHSAPSPDRIFASASSENSSAQSSVVSTPTDTLPITPHDLSERRKCENRSARVTTGLAIDIERLTSSMISLGSDSSDVLDDMTVTAGPVYEPEPETWISTLRCVPIPSITVSPASEDAGPDLPSSILISPSATQSDTRGASMDLRNEGSTRHNQPRISGFNPKLRLSHVSMAHACIITNNTVGATTNLTCHSYRATPPLAPPSTINDLSSRRVGLRGKAPRYRFATVLPENKSLDLCPDARAHLGEPSSRRVGLYGALPRQRFSNTINGAGNQTHTPDNAKVSVVAQVGAALRAQALSQSTEKDKEAEALVATAERERAVIFERHRARALFFAQRDMHSGPGLRLLLLPLHVAARNSGAVPAVARSWGLPF